jgi:hypothetical protein
MNGEKYDSTKIIFSGDRLDEPYRNFPGGWPGIYFSPSSKDNVLTYSIIKNAYQGIITQSPASNNNFKIILNQCIINNIYDAGILSIASTIKATNCLISNCGNNIAIAGGGNYNFDHCTIASIGNNYLAHKNPVLFISNANEQGQVNSLSARFRNCILWGEGGIVDNEVVIAKTVNATSITFANVLYKVKDVPANATFNNSANIKSPEFDSIDAGRRIFDFHLKSNSPAVNAGINIFVPIDLDGKLRSSVGPDIGCYEN